MTSRRAERRGRPVPTPARLTDEPAVDAPKELTHSLADKLREAGYEVPQEADR